MLAPYFVRSLLRMSLRSFAALSVTSLVARYFARLSLLLCLLLTSLFCSLLTLLVSTSLFVALLLRSLLVRSLLLLRGTSLARYVARYFVCILHRSSLVASFGRTLLRSRVT